MVVLVCLADDGHLGAIAGRHVELVAQLLGRANHCAGAAGMFFRYCYVEQLF
jgi:hypothetical protein